MTTELVQATKDYWLISLLYHQGVGITLNVSQAIHKAGDAAFSVGPHRRVRHKLLNLQSRIIRGKSRKNKKPEASGTVSLLPLRRQV